MVEGGRIPQNLTLVCSGGSLAGVSRKPVADFERHLFQVHPSARTKPRHHIAGTVNRMGVRGVVEPAGDGFGFTLGPAWLHGCGLGVGDTVAVEIEPEGPQRDDLAEDIAGALAAHPEAGAFFDALAQFYRRAYLRWIDATKRHPEKRAQRIAEVIRLLEAGQKQRPEQ